MTSRRLLSSCLLFFALALAQLSRAQTGLDPTFGAGGWEVTPIGESALLRGLAVAPDGSLVAAGAAFEAPHDNIVVARYSPDGQLLTERPFLLGDGAGFDSMAMDVAVLEDGRLLVLASAIRGEHYLVVLRLQPALELDASFGIDGIAMIPIGDDVPREMTIQPDGRIVVLTSSGVWRLLPDGVIDTSFGANGWAPHGLWSSDRGLGLQANGRVIVAGRSQGGLTVAALTPAGQPSASFGTAGMSIVDNQGRAVAIAIQPDDAILIVGALGPGDSFDSAVWRVDASGQLDETFGSSGRVRLDLDVFDSFAAVMVQPDASIVAAGFRSDTDTLAASVSTIARLSKDGTLDDRFGTGGVVQTQPEGHGSNAVAVVDQPGRGMVIGGDVRQADESPIKFGLARVGRPANLPPSVTSARATPGALWPANHKLVDVTVAYDVLDDGTSAPTCTLEVTSDQPVDGKSDGHTAADWEVIDSHHVRLRAERAAQLGTRTYTIGITCVDSGGLSAQTQVQVAVVR